MADDKKTPGDKQARPRVMTMTLANAVDFLTLGSLTYVKALTEGEQEAYKTATQKSLSMELDRSLGGVVVSWEDKQGKAHKKLIPMANICGMELDEN